MRKVLLAVALSLGWISAIAGPPTPPTVSVEVVNAPLPVTTLQATIPFDKVGSAGIKGFQCRLRRATNHPDSWTESLTCTDESAYTLSEPILVWNVILMSGADGYPLDESDKSASCQATYLLSVDNGVSFKRIAQESWSPGQYQSVVVPFTVPVELPAGSSVKQQLIVNMNGGMINDGCFAMARTLTSGK